jgi:hypothetical protein
MPPERAPREPDNTNLANLPGRDGLLSGHVLRKKADDQPDE